MNVGTEPDAGVDGKAGVGEAGSEGPIWVSGTAVGLVEKSDTAGV